MVEDKIFNSGYNSVVYGNANISQQINVSPCVEDDYQDNLSDNMEDVYIKRQLHDDINSLYKESDYYQKYGQDDKRIERADTFDIYYSFKEKLLEKGDYTIVEIFCEIAEFFGLNYKLLYNNILTLEDKVEILDYFGEERGLEKQFAKSKRLF